MYYLVNDDKNSFLKTNDVKKLNKFKRERKNKWDEVGFWKFNFAKFIYNAKLFLR